MKGACTKPFWKKNCSLSCGACCGNLWDDKNARGTEHFAEQDVRSERSVEKRVEYAKDNYISKVVINLIIS